MRFYKFTIVMTPENDDPDVYNVTVPAFPEIATFGESREEARFIAQDALELVILSRLEEDEAIPKNKRPTNVAPGAKLEEIVIAISHQVQATPADHVKIALFQTT